MLVQLYDYSYASLKRLDAFLTKELQSFPGTLHQEQLRTSIARLRRVRLFGSRLHDDSRVTRFSYWGPHVRILEHLRRAWRVDDTIESINRKMERWSNWMSSTSS